MPNKTYFVYILSNKRNGTLYTGITNNLIRRVFEHKAEITQGFTKKYKINNLVYYEPYTDINLAIQREKQIKKFNRLWKLNLIESINPEWKDLYEQFKY